MADAGGKRRKSTSRKDGCEERARARGRARALAFGFQPASSSARSKEKGGNVRVMCRVRPENKVRGPGHGARRAPRRPPSRRVTPRRGRATPSRAQMEREHGGRDVREDGRRLDRGRVRGRQLPLRLRQRVQPRVDAGRGLRHGAAADRRRARRLQRDHLRVRSDGLGQGARALPPSPSIPFPPRARETGRRPRGRAPPSRRSRARARARRVCGCIRLFGAAGGDDRRALSERSRPRLRARA